MAKAPETTAVTSPIPAPARRAAASTIRRQSHQLAGLDLLRQLGDCIGEALVVLNRQRQIVFCNGHFTELAGVKEGAEIIGRRPGEVLDCVHACQSPGGCGTSAFCSTCQSLNAILAAQNGQHDRRDCRIVRPDGAALDLSVRTSPLVIRSETFTLLAIRDISGEKRRRTLERAFFHDLSNTLSGLSMLSQRLQASTDGQSDRLGSVIAQGLRQMLDQIAAQRELVSAENHELPVRPLEASSRELLANVLETYQHLAADRGCRLTIDPAAHDAAIRTDISLFSRVLGNLVKNAIEASAAGAAVTLNCRPQSGGLAFLVHNPARMSDEVQLHMFQRTVSTKGPGRGIGTYGAKVLTERYLKGQISFTSTDKDGTTFVVWCPMELA